MNKVFKIVMYILLGLVCLLALGLLVHFIGNLDIKKMHGG
jgi:hypothetical protein